MDLESPAWYCVRTRQKQEHIAAANLRQLGFEIFNPRLRLRRATQRGPVWFTESLFPSYLFTRFPLHARLQEVRGTSGVATLVQFGQHHPVIPDEVISKLREITGPQETIIQDQTVAPGESILVAAGPFRGLFGVVQQILPASERVRILLDLLGRSTEVELQAAAVVHPNVRAWKQTVAGHSI